MINLNVLCHTMDSKKTAIFPSSGSLCRFRITIAVLRTNVEVIVLTLLAESLFHIHYNLINTQRVGRFSLLSTNTLWTKFKRYTFGMYRLFFNRPKMADGKTANALRAAIHFALNRKPLIGNRNYFQPFR